MSYAWVKTTDGRSIYRKVERSPRGIRSDLAAPGIVRAFSEPVQSMADGKWYDNPRDLENTYKAANNPHGVDFVQVGNENVEQKSTEYKPDFREIKEDIRQAKADLDAGWRPEIAQLEV